MKTTPTGGLNLPEATPGQRLKVVLRYLDKTQKQLGEAVGYSEGTMTAAVKHDRIPQHLAERLQTLYAISPVWLLTGQGPMLVNEDAPEGAPPPDGPPRPELRAARLLDCCPVKLQPDEWATLAAFLLDIVERPHVYVATLQGAKRLKKAQATEGE